MNNEVKGILDLQLENLSSIKNSLQSEMYEIKNQISLVQADTKSNIRKIDDLATRVMSVQKQIDKIDKQITDIKENKITESDFEDNNRLLKAKDKYDNTIENIELLEQRKKYLEQEKSKRTTAFYKLKYQRAIEKTDNSK